MTYLWFTGSWPSLGNTTFRYYVDGGQGDNLLEFEYFLGMGIGM